MPKLSYPYLCGVDWFQVYGFLHSELVPQTKSFSLSLESFPTQQFLMRARVKFGDSEFCELLVCPRTTLLPGNAFQLKIQNKWLYTSEWFNLFRRVCTEFDLEVKSVSRIDVFFDCIKYWGGRRPSRLISEYVSQKILKIGVNRGYLAFKNFGYAIPVGSQHAEVPIGAPKWNGITWGQKGYVQTQIYNKSLELREVKFKPWIVDAWEAAGLRGEDIWRTEIRIQKNGKSLQLLETGDLFALGCDEVSNEARIWDLFLTYADRYVRFVVRDYHRKRQQMKPIKLFPSANEWEAPFRLKHPSREVTTNRTISIVSNYLRNVRNAVSMSNPTPLQSEYAHMCENAADALKSLFQGYQFGQSSSRFSPEIAWLAAKRLNPALESSHKVITPMPFQPDLFMQVMASKCSYPHPDRDGRKKNPT